MIFPLHKSNQLRDRPKLNPWMLRAFTTEDFSPVPEDWEIRSPHFIGLGIQKAGTSWWFSLIQRHPQVIQNRLGTKELNYFNHFFARGLNQAAISTYCQAFAAPEGYICGEWSVMYLSNPFCLEYLSQAVPQAKLLVLLRNPIDRFISGVNQIMSARAKYFTFNKEQLNLYKIFDAYPESIFHSLYKPSLEKLLKLFERKQILILQYEQCKKNPKEQIKKTYQFLGIDSSYMPQNLTRRVHQRQYIISLPASEERRNLAEYFAADVRATVEMFPEIDLSFWPDFIR